jgi:hypothetical protein
MNSNGTIKYEICVGGKKLVEKVARGRITAKRVSTAFLVWTCDGKRVSAYHPGMLPVRLLSYQQDGQDEVVLTRKEAA